MSTRQSRMSIGCRDWMETVAALGAEAAAVYLYLRMLMRSIQAGEISLTLQEIAQGVKLPTDRADAALASICPGHMTRSDGPDGLITLSCPAEIRALSEAARKRAERALKNSKKAIGQSEYIFFAQPGQSADSPTQPACEHAQNSYTSEVMMYYHPQPGEPGRDESSYYFRKKKEKGSHTLFNQSESGMKREKAPHTPEKEKSLTESTGHAHASAPVREAANASTGRQMSAATRADEVTLAADQLEADYIDVIGTWPDSLREALRNETTDVREAFYLYVRTRKAEDGKAWSADKVRIAWLAARRIPAERRAESILAASMGGWKTIRDAGSGVYFEKSTGRIVSLVRGPVEPVSPRGCMASSAAREFARRMREE